MVLRLGTKQTGGLDCVPGHFASESWETVNGSRVARADLAWRQFGYITLVPTPLHRVHQLP